VRSLSAVAKALSMGCRVSHSPKPTKKFKFPRKVLLLVPVLLLVIVCVCVFFFQFLCCFQYLMIWQFPKVGNGVDHASVPRKIRSGGLFLDSRWKMSCLSSNKYSSSFHTSLSVQILLFNFFIRVEQQRGDSHFPLFCYKLKGYSVMIQPCVVLSEFWKE